MHDCKSWSRNKPRGVWWIIQSFRSRWILTSSDTTAGRNPEEFLSMSPKILQSGTYSLLNRGSRVTSASQSVSNLSVLIEWENCLRTVWLERRKSESRNEFALHSKYQTEINAGQKMIVIWVYLNPDLTTSQWVTDEKKERKKPVLHLASVVVPESERKRQEEQWQYEGPSWKMALRRVILDNISFASNRMRSERQWIGSGASSFLLLGATL